MESPGCPVSGLRAQELCPASPKSGKQTSRLQGKSAHGKLQEGVFSAGGKSLVPGMSLVQEGQDLVAMEREGRAR